MPGGYFPTRREAIATALSAVGDGCIKLCHGKERCERVHSPDIPFEPCPWCYSIDFGDKRSVEEIEAHIDQIQLGH